MMTTEGYLKIIADNSTPKPSFHVIQTGNTSKLETNFVPPLNFNGDNCNYEIALISLETYYSFPNIDDENNRLRFSHDNGKTWKDITLHTGCYELKAINKTLESLIIEAGGHKGDLKVEANKNTFQCIMTVAETVQIDFTTKNSLRTVLGFEPKVFGAGLHTSTHTVNIMRVNSILVQCDVIGASYLNGTQKPIIYSFFPDVGPGDKIVMEPKTLIYLPLSLNIISRMSSWMTDQDNKLLDLREEEVTLKFHIRSC